MKNAYFITLLVLLVSFLTFLSPVHAWSEDKAAPVYARAEDRTVEAPKQDNALIQGSALSQPLQQAPDYNLALAPFADSNEVASRAVERNLGLFTSRIRDKFSLWLSRSGKYLDLMKEILRKKDIPEDIVFLSLIESGFNPYAYSIAKAAGPWQFIASTAKRYGLVINWWKDERRDPIKSTEAAADYLRDLYEMFGSWNLAMAAYNAGEGRILRALKKSNAEDYWALIGTTHIKEETKDYVPKFIAASLIATNPKDFGFGDVEYNQPMSYDEVDLDSPVDLTVAAECAGTELDVIKKLNPELRRWCTPPDVPHYTLRIPQGAKEAFLKKLAAVPEEERFTIERYTVRKGDTLKRISKRTGIPEAVVLSLNSMERIMPLKVDSKIYLPPKGIFEMDHDDTTLVKKASYKKVIKKASYRNPKKKLLSKGKIRKFKKA